MTDYSCENPVWWASDGAMVEPEELPLSDATNQALQAWEDWYEAGEVVGRKHGWKSPGEIERFDQEAQRLRNLVAADLGDEWAVGYFSQSSGERLWPDED